MSRQATTPALHLLPETANQDGAQNVQQHEFRQSYEKSTQVEHQRSPRLRNSRRFRSMARSRSSSRVRSCSLTASTRWDIGSAAGFVPPSISPIARRMTAPLNSSLLWRGE